MDNHLLTIREDRLLKSGLVDQYQSLETCVRDHIGIQAQYTNYSLISMLLRTQEHVDIDDIYQSPNLIRSWIQRDTVHFLHKDDFFAISSRVADVLRTNYREKTRFLRGYVQSVGFRKTTLEYTAAERAGGASHYTLKKLMNFAISTIVGFSDFPLKLGLYAGAVSFLAAVIFAISALCGFREYKVILAAVNVLFAVLFLLVGIMGEYFSVAFAELKNRPIDIVAKEINSGHCV